MRALCLVRDQPVYRRESFIAGLRAVGYDVRDKPFEADEGDVLVIWNRYAEWHERACAWEARGGTVLVAENAYLGLDRRDRRRYALACEGHNGSGFWPMGGPERWAALGIDLRPWREAGEHVLVCPNRSFGSPKMTMPSTWVDDVVRRLKRVTDRPIRVRPHPGNTPPTVPLERDLDGAWCVVIWSSSVGCEALVAGIPVICEAPYWIAKAAACNDATKVESLVRGDRLAAMQRLAWAQWHVDEIASGLAFEHLLQRPLRH